MMEPCAARLAAHGFRVLRLRYLGGGEDSYDYLARTIVRLVADRDAHGAVILAESFGGGVAMRVALESPDRLAALAIVNSFACYPFRRRLFVSRVVGSVMPPSVYSWLRVRFGLRKLLGPRWDPALVARAASQQPKFDAAYRARLRMIGGLDLRPRLAEIRLPVTLFAADQDQIVPSLECARDLARSLPDAELCVLENAGHLVLPVEAFDWPGWIEALFARAAG